MEGDKTAGWYFVLSTKKVEQGWKLCFGALTARQRSLGSILASRQVFSSYCTCFSRE